MIVYKKRRLGLALLLHCAGMHIATFSYAQANASVRPMHGDFVFWTCRALAPSHSPNRVVRRADNSVRVNHCAGSALPGAILPAILAAILATVIKGSDGVMGSTFLAALIRNPYPFQAFGSMVGFATVFRTNSVTARYTRDTFCGCVHPASIWRASRCISLYLS